MKTIRRSFLIPFIFLVAHPLSGAFAEDGLTPPDYVDAAGIHSWRVKIPSDLDDDEYLTSHWFYPTKDIPPVFTGIDFKEVLPGSTAKLFIWLGKGHILDAEKMRGMRYCLIYTGKDEKPARRDGMMKRIPTGFNELYTFQPSGKVAEIGSIIMLCDPSRNPATGMISFEIYKTKFEKPSSERESENE